MSLISSLKRPEDVAVPSCPLLLIKTSAPLEEVAPEIPAMKVPPVCVPWFQSG